MFKKCSYCKNRIKCELNCNEVDAYERIVGYIEGKSFYRINKWNIIIGPNIQFINTKGKWYVHERLVRCIVIKAYLERIRR